MATRANSSCIALVFVPVLAACGADPSPSGPWLVERNASVDLNPARFSSGNVSRPAWTAISEPIRIRAGSAGRVEFELALAAEISDPADSMELLLETRGETLPLSLRADSRQGWWHAQADLPAISEGGFLRLRSKHEEGEAAMLAPRVSLPRIHRRRDSTKRFNVLFVSIDTLRADVLGCYGHDRDTSPRIDGLAREGVLFERAISQASWTLPSYASLFTGRVLESHGIVHVDHRFAPAFTSFVELFAEAGYSTAAVVSGSFLDSVWGFDQGFDHYDDLGMVVDDAGQDEGFAPSDIGEMRERANRRITSPEVTDRAIEWLEDHRDRRFFLFAQYFDPHDTYLEHPGFSERFPPRPVPPDFPGSVDPDPERTARERALYEGEVAFTDHHIGRLFDRLKELGLWQQTIVVLSSDHGEEFFERNQIGHGNSLYDELVRVPMILRVPGLSQAGKRVPEAVGTIDLAPTLLELCRLPALDEAQGESLTAWLGSERPARTRPVTSALYPSFAPEPGTRARIGAYRVDRDTTTFITYLRKDGLSFLRFDAERDRWQATDLGQDQARSSLTQHQEYMQLRAEWLRQRDAPESLELSSESMQTLEELGYGGD